MLKPAIIAAVILSFLAPTLAQAAPRHDERRPGYSHSHRVEPQRHARPQHRDVRRHHNVRRHDWKRGQHVSNWRRQPVVKDYHRHGLRRPGPGQQWVKVDNNYMLLSMASGLILGLAAAR
ncbi:membrane protein [Agaricicola taiwanensis]|uniref:Membrane protein n=1 Tax=Agaricicola taiwanensis TaxID=591372 RepID=A0A8J2YNJ5_9RHOB|nr:RcnB family protein [Agaricicola taiwanensis]GGE54531.1 membrane protein [Agaricicola taiwanensis]